MSLAASVLRTTRILTVYPVIQLTHLLRDVLHGWGQLLMCVNVSPTAKDFEATVDTLRYATLARRIGTAARAQPPARVIR